MNEHDVKRMADSHRSRLLEKMEEDRKRNQEINTFYHELRFLLKRLDQSIFRTPTSETRNLLTDCAIIVRFVLDHRLPISE